LGDTWFTYMPLIFGSFPLFEIARENACR
jgi:hypothetical protein